VKNFLNQSVKILLGLIILCTVLEIILRFLAQYSYKIRFYVTNPYQQQYLSTVSNWQDLLAASCCWSPPGSLVNGFVLNSHGFETPEIPYQKSPTTKRLVVLGDSQTVGYVPYPKGWVRLMEQQIINTVNPSFQAINLGIYGIGPGLEEKILNIEGRLYKPDVVLLSFFVGNDYIDDMLYKQKYEQTSHVIPLFMYQSRLFSFFRNVVHIGIGIQKISLSGRNVSKQSGTYTGESIDSNSGMLTKDDFTNLEIRTADMLRKDSYVYSNLDYVKKAILSIKSQTENLGAKFIVLIIPDQIQLNPQLLSEIQGKKKEPKELYDVELPQKIIKDFFDSNYIRYVDILPSWINIADSSGYFLSQNQHLNAQGNQAIADIITPVISELFSAP
jgi:hypothetical protein